MTLDYEDQSQIAGRIQAYRSIRTSIEPMLVELQGLIQGWEESNADPDDRLKNINLQLYRIGKTLEALKPNPWEPLRKVPMVSECVKSFGAASIIVIIANNFIENVTGNGLSPFDFLITAIGGGISLAYLNRCQGMLELENKKNNFNAVIAYTFRPLLERMAAIRNPLIQPEDIEPLLELLQHRDPNKNKWHFPENPFYQNNPPNLQP